MQILPATNLKAYIKDRATEEQLFAYFLDTTVGKIIECINYKYKLNNPLRHDEHASLSIFKTIENNQERIRIYDWANKTYRGDIFELVGLIINKDVNTGKGFVDICKHIISIIPFLEDDSNTSLISEHSICDITVNSRDFEAADMKYWKEYKIPEKRILKNVTAVEYATLNDKQCYVYRKSDPCYGYYLGKYRDVILWQLYFPKRRKPDVRFITNNVYPFMKIGNMKDGESLFITKSIKDVMCYETLKDSIQHPILSLQGNVTFDITSMDIVSLSSEAIRFDIRVANFLKDKYKDIYINSDFDTAGIQCVKFYQKAYGFKPVLTWDRRHKDTASLLRNNTINNTFKLLYERNVSN